MADRTIVMAQNGRHGLRGVSARNPSEFEAYQDDSDNLTYTVDMASYLSTDTISSVTRVPFGLTVSNAANTTTQITQRLKGFGYVDIKATLASGDTEQFRIHILPRVPTQITGAQDYIEVPVATTATRDPTTADDSTQNFVPGNLWINTTSQDQFTCITNAVGAARWRHHPRVLGSSIVAIAHTGTTAETKLASVAVNATALGSNGTLQIVCTWSNTNNANNKTGRVRFGAADNLTGTAYMQFTNTTNVLLRDTRHIANVNATNSQKSDMALGQFYTGAGAGTLVTSLIDTTAVSYVVFSAELANAGDTLTLEYYRVTLTRPDIAP